MDGEPIEETTSEVDILSDLGLDDGVPKSEESAPQETPKSEDVPKEEPKATEPKPEAVSKEEPAPKPTEEATPAPLVDERDAIIASLRDEVTRLAKGPAPQTPALPPAPTSPEAPKPTQGKEVELIQFVTEEEYDNLFKSRDAMNGLLSRVFYAGRAQAQRDLMPVMHTMSVQQVATQIAVRDFYNTNPDLIPLMDYNAKVAEELEAKDPKLAADTTKLFMETAKEVRKRLGLPTPGAKKEDSPALPGRTGGGHRGTPTTAQPTGVELELAELMD